MAGAARAFQSAGRSGSASTTYRLSTITVQGYDPQTGQLITDLRDRSWNQIDLSLLAAVEVIGPEQVSTSGPLVEVTIVKGDKVVSRQKMKVGAPHPRSGRYFVPTWITGPFCEDLVIRARLVGQRDESRVEKRFQFRCGE